MIGSIAGTGSRAGTGVVDGEPVDTTIGGLDAVQFDVAITDEVECGEDFCVRFATNRGFDPSSGTGAVIGGTTRSLWS